MNIVLHEPCIPQNTGNIMRTCACTNSTLHLIHPLGFSLEQKYLKRASLDYYPLVTYKEYKDLDDFFLKNDVKNFFLATTKAEKNYTEVSYKENSFLFFGKETAGLPRLFIDKNIDRSIRIPMSKQTEYRSLNLSNAVNIILFEALRQNNFKNMS